jgi:putative addiction module killer protein
VDKPAAREWRVDYYSTPAEEVPFRNWRSELRDRVARALVDARITRFRKFGHAGNAKPVGDGVMELKFDLGPGYRIYYAVSGTEVILLLCGGRKGRQQEDIDMAKKYWKEFKGRSEKGHAVNAKCKKRGIH